jgi:hypothetical protein
MRLIIRSNAVIARLVGAGKTTVGAARRALVVAGDCQPTTPSSRRTVAAAAARSRGSRERRPPGRAGAAVRCVHRGRRPPGVLGGVLASRAGASGPGRGRGARDGPAVRGRRVLPGAAPRPAPGSRSRWTRPQWRESTSSLWRKVSISSRPVFHTSACSATIRRVRFSPAPPIISGNRAWSGFGPSCASSSW